MYYKLVWIHIESIVIILYKLCKSLQLIFLIGTYQKRRYHQILMAEKVDFCHLGGPECLWELQRAFMDLSDSMP